MILHSYLCFFDLEKAFDSVEYSTLPTHTFELGINGKCWPIIKDWYSDSHSVVRVNQLLSECFNVERGVKQGSVLSPILFILTYHDSSGQGLTISGLNVGNSAHADDVSC